MTSPTGRRAAGGVRHRDAGGTSGIGRGLAVRLHEAGNRVIVAGRRREHLDEIVAAREGIHSEVFDITDDASVRRLAETVTGKHPDLNVLSIF